MWSYQRLFPFQPVFFFHPPEYLCAMTTSGCFWLTPSSPSGCVPSTTFGNTRTFQNVFPPVRSPSKCDMMVSVNAPGPVRSSVLRFEALVNTRFAPALMCSATARSAGCPGAPANAQFNTCRLRTKCLEYAFASDSNSFSQPTISVSFASIISSKGFRHSVSMSAYTPPCFKITKYRKKSLRSTFFTNAAYAS